MRYEVWVPPSALRARQNRGERGRGSVQEKFVLCIIARGTIGQSCTTQCQAEVWVPPSTLGAKQKREKRGRVSVQGKFVLCIIWSLARDTIEQCCTTQCEAEEGKEGASGSRSRAAFCNQPAPPAPLTGAPPLLVIVIVIYINIIMYCCLPEIISFIIVWCWWWWTEMLNLTVEAKPRPCFPSWELPLVVTPMGTLWRKSSKICFLF